MEPICFPTELQRDSTGLHDTIAAPAHTAEGQPDASAAASKGPCNASERIKDDQAPSQGPMISLGLREKLILALVPEPSDEGFEEKPVLVLVPELSDEVFEDEPPHFPEPEVKTPKLWPEVKTPRMSDFTLGP
ncbi:hypothetical protein CRENBAI_003002 [Crenichthys baileyi]|uniref:Uncharacterized protein n=1 Tax=Crenichthys baileyi TaxID=28760 RepID=A0AAV9SFB0_9TELE